MHQFYLTSPLILLISGEKYKKRTILNINKKEREHKYLVEKEAMFSLK